MLQRVKSLSSSHALRRASCMLSLCLHYPSSPAAGGERAAAVHEGWQGRVAELQVRAWPGPSPPIGAALRATLRCGDLAETTCMHCVSVRLVFAEAVGHGGAGVPGDRHPA